MSFWPHTKLDFNTALTEEEVMYRLAQLVQQEKYEGAIEQNKFSLTRVIKYRNSFRPTIKGLMTQTDNGTLVAISLELAPMVKIFIPLMLVFFLGVIAVFVFAFLSQSTDFFPIQFFLFPLMSVVVSVVFFFAFKHECEIAKSDLLKALQKP